MAAGDIALKLMITGDAAGAIGAMSGLSGAFKNIGNGLGNLAFGFNNLGTAGKLGTQAMTQGMVQMGKSFLEIGAMAVLAGAAIAVAIGIKAVKSAGDFEAAMTRLVTSAGELPQNLKMVSAGILQMSVDTATGTDQLAKGMYFVESSGYHAADGLNVLKVAAMGAKSENADLDVVSKALTTTMVDYHMKSSQAADAMNGLIVTVQNGKTTLQDLSSSMGAVLPIASALGISFPQVAGSIDTMTNAGMPAQQAAQNLAHVLVALSAPSKVAVKSMKDVGLSAQQVKDALVNQGLPAALQLIEDHIGKKYPAGSVANETATKNIMGGLVGLKLSAMLTGKSLGETTSNIEKITQAMHAGSKGVLGWNEVQATFNFKMDQAKQALGVFMIQLGTKLIPIFTQLMTVLMPVILGFLNWAMNSGILQGIIQTLVNVLIFLVNTGTAVVGFFKNNEIAMAALKATLIVLADIIGGAMVMALYSMAAAAWTAMIPFLPIIAVVALVIVIVTAVILIVQHWGQIAHWLQGVWAPIAGFFVGLWNGIKSVAMTVWNAIAGFFKAVFTPIGAFFQAAWGVILNILTVAWNVIKMIVFVVFAIIVAAIITPFLPMINWFKQHWEQIKAVLVAVWNVISGIAKAVWDTIAGIFTSNVQKVQMIITVSWNFLKGMLTAIWNVISGIASAVWNTIANAIKGPVQAVQGWLGTAWDNIKKAFSNVMGALGGIAKSAWDGVVGIVKGAINLLITLIDNIIGGINNVTGTIGIPGIPMIPHFASGTSYAPGGMALVGERGPEMVYLPRGSQVVPNSQLSSRGSFAVGGSGGATQHVHIHPAPVMIDKRQIGEILFNYQAQEVRRQGGVRSR